MNPSTSGSTAHQVGTETPVEALRQENALLRSMLEATPLGVCALQPVLDSTGQAIDFVVLAFNQASLRYVAATPFPLAKGFSFSQLVPGARETGLFDRLRQVFETGEPQQAEIPHFLENTPGWYLIRFQKQGEHLLATFHDLSQPLLARQTPKEKGSLLQNVLNTIQAGVFVSEAVRNEAGEVIDFRVIEANPVALRTIGLTLEEVIGQLTSKIFPYSHSSGVFNRYLTVLETGEAQQYEIPYFGDGLSAWFSVRLVPDGTERVISSTLDITSIKEAQLSQQRQTQTLQGILENIPSGLFITEAVRNAEGTIVDFRLIEANRVGLSAYGLSRDAAVGQLTSVLFPWDHQNGIFERYRRVIEVREPDFFTFSFSENEMPGWIDVRLTPHRDNWVIASSLDITAIKEAERVQFQQAELLQGVLDSSQHSIVFLEAIRDGNNRVVDFWYAMQNAANARNIGLSDEEIRGRTLLELFPGTGLSGLFDRYVEVAETGVSQRLEEFYEGQGLKGWFDISVAKRGDGVVVTIVDITETRQFRQQLEVANAELRRSNDNLQQFAYVASHDLQEPLRKIQAFGEILVKEYGMALDESGADLVRRMQSAADRMSVLIRDLLSYSRITTHREPFQEVDLNGLLTEVLNDLDLLIRDKSARIERGPLPVTHGDRSQLGQLFQNLISNALKFGKPGEISRISISSRRVLRRDLPPVLLATERTHYHEISIEDNGVGFDEKYTERIFQVFQRLHGKSQFPGTGIGLAICRKVVENHHGTITAASKPGEGATFRVYLPEVE
ncbi:PAS domain-containing protein [Tellurirhabdus rosea]|uniref:PAS domain-containing protein n=1 Tax=Tellurirhabdus rosea TaxID=2674997 RepID=UPI002256F5F9|nr:PAS domain-containing protein [Tellurirhabdus rosea]